MIQTITTLLKWFKYLYSNQIAKWFICHMLKFKSYITILLTLLITSIFVKLLLKIIPDILLFRCIHSPSMSFDVIAILKLTCICSCRTIYLTYWLICNVNRIQMLIWKWKFQHYLQVKKFILTVSHDCICFAFCGPVTIQFEYYIWTGSIVQNSYNYQAWAFKLYSYCNIPNIIYFNV